MGQVTRCLLQLIGMNWTKMLRCSDWLDWRRVMAGGFNRGFITGAFISTLNNWWIVWVLNRKKNKFRLTVGKWKNFAKLRKSMVTLDSFPGNHGTQPLQNIEFLSSHDAHTHHHVDGYNPKSSGSETSPSFEYLFYVPQSRWENLSSFELTKMGEKNIVDYGLLHIHRGFLINPQGIIQLSINQSMAAWLPDLLLNFGKVQGLKGWGNSAAAFLWFLSLNTFWGMRWRSCKRWQRRHWKRWRVESFWYACLSCLDMFKIQNMDSPRFMFLPKPTAFFLCCSLELPCI